MTSRTWSAVQRRSMLAGVTLIALIFRVWGLTWGLQNSNVSLRPHPDEWVVYWVFRWFDSSHALNPCPNAQTQCFFDWGGAFLYLSYAAHIVLTPIFALVPMSAFGPHADPAFVHSALAGRLTSVLVSTLTVIVVYAAGVEMEGPRTGIVAALLVALSGLLIQLAHFATPDSTTVFLLSLSLLALLRALHKPSLARFAIAGALCGLSTGSEYNMGLLIVPLLAAWLMAGDREWHWILVAVVAMAAGWIAVNPYAVIDAGAFVDRGMHSLRFRTVESRAAYQDRWSAYNPSILYVVRFPLGYGVGFALTIWLLVGVAWAAIQHRRSDLLLLAWIVPYFILVTVSPAKFMRYSAPLLPPLALLAASFLADALASRRVALRVSLAVAALLAALYSGVYDAAYGQLFTRPDPRQVATAWLQKHAPRSAQVGFEELPNGLLNLPYFVTLHGYQPCFSQFKTTELRSPARYILTDEYDLEEHPLVSNQQVRAFRRALSSDRQYRIVLNVHYVPQFLGWTFPIDASPHDWRYVDRNVTIYAHVARDASSGGQCYPTLQAATTALYVHPSLSG